MAVEEHTRGGSGRLAQPGKLGASAAARRPAGSGGPGATADDSADHPWRSTAHYSSSTSGRSSSSGGNGGGAEGSAPEGAHLRATSPSAVDGGAGAPRAPRSSSSQQHHSDASCGGYSNSPDADADAGADADADALAAAHIGDSRGEAADGGVSPPDSGSTGEEERSDDDERYREASGASMDVDAAAAASESPPPAPGAAASAGRGPFFAPASPRRWCTNCASGVVLIEHPGVACPKCGHRPADDDLLFATEPEEAGGEAAAAAAAGSGEGAEPAAAEASAVGGAAAAAPPAPELLLCWDEAMLQHEDDDDCPHPERPDRLRAVIARLERRGIAARCRRAPARPATDEEVLRVHTPEHLSRLRAAADWPPGALHAAHWLPADTYVNEHTFDAALLAAGSAVEVAVAVVRGEARAGAAIVRPPGHHAESNTAMGFCFFNNSAIAARAARAAGAERVLIVDWDVHHGNGTQHVFEDAPDVLYASLHRWDGGAFYPGTGAPSEVGWGAGRGFNVNVGWDGPGATDGDYDLAMRAVLLPIVAAYAPSLIIVSAGFDAAHGDPIGGCRLTAGAFARMTEQLAALAPVALLLEGGYNLSATAAATEACVRVLMGERAPPLEAGPGQDVTLAGWRGVQAALAAQARFWPCVEPAVGAAPPPHVAELIARAKEEEAARRAAAARQAALWQQRVQQQQQQQQPLAGQRPVRLSREATPVEERPWSSRFRRPSFSVANEARLHMARAGLSRKQQLLRHLHRRALKLALKRRCAVAQRRPEAAAAAPGPRAEAPAQASPVRE